MTTAAERGAELASTMTMREALALQAPQAEVDAISRDVYLTDSFDQPATIGINARKARLLWADYMLAEMVGCE